MWPLSSSQRTAFIFYLVYAGFLLLSAIWSPVKPISSTSTNWGRLELKKGNNDLSNLQSSFTGLWEDALKQKGFDPEGLMLDAESKLEERKLGKARIKWISVKSKVLLPKTVSEQELAELINDWEKINRSLELNSADIKWGYQKNQLWLRLANGISVETPGGPKTFPLNQLTILIPVEANLNLKWPGIIPKLPPAIEPPVKVEPPKKVTTVEKPRVALIIDDVGSVRKAADRMLEVPARLTWSVLPFTPYAAEYIEAARERGFEVILHLPMEPLDKKNNPGPGVIKGEWTEPEIIKQLEANLNQVPGATGINNHMGSAGTADERLMEIIMGHLKSKSIYFIDSMTSQRSLGEDIARRHQVNFNKRDIFIDNLEDPDSKKRALRELIQVALAKGEAIGIGHVRNGTAEAIIEMLPEFEKEGIEIVPVSELVGR